MIAMQASVTPERAIVLLAGLLQISTGMMKLGPGTNRNR